MDPDDETGVGYDDLIFGGPERSDDLPLPPSKSLSPSPPRETRRPKHQFQTTSDLPPSATEDELGLSSLGAKRRRSLSRSRSPSISTSRSGEGPVDNKGHTDGAEQPPKEEALPSRIGMRAWEALTGEDDDPTPALAEEELERQRKERRMALQQRELVLKEAEAKELAARSAKPVPADLRPPSSAAGDKGDIVLTIKPLPPPPPTPTSAPLVGPPSGPPPQPKRTQGREQTNEDDAASTHTGGGDAEDPFHPEESWLAEVGDAETIESLLVGHKQQQKPEKKKKKKGEKSKSKSQSDPKVTTPSAAPQKVNNPVQRLTGVKGPPYPGRLLVEGMWYQLADVEATQRSIRAEQEGPTRYVPGLHCHAWRFKAQCSSGATCNYVHALAERGRLASLAHPTGEGKKRQTTGTTVPNAIYDPPRQPKKRGRDKSEKKKKKQKRKDRSRSRSRSRSRKKNRSASASSRSSTSS